MRLFVLACLVFLTLADSTSGSGNDVGACTKACFTNSTCSEDMESCSFCALRCIYHGASDNNLQCFVQCSDNARGNVTKTQACPATCGLSGGGTSGGGTSDGGTSGGGTSGGGTSGGGTSGGGTPGDRDVCITGCADEMKTCAAAAKSDTSAAKICSDKLNICAIKCSIPGFPDSAYICAGGCNMQNEACYTKIQNNTPAGNTPNTEPCDTQSNVCVSKCLNPSLPDCLQDQEDSRVFVCMKKNGNFTDKPKDCAGVNIVIKCLQTECNGIPKIFATAYGLDELKKNLCPTLSPTVVGGTLSPTTSDYVGIVPTNKPLPPSSEPSAGSTVSCVLQLVSVLIVCLML